VPKCSNCQLYDTECVFGEDKRRYVEATGSSIIHGVVPPAEPYVRGSSTAKTLNALKTRLEEVEARLAQQQARDPIGQNQTPGGPPEPLEEAYQFSESPAARSNSLASEPELCAPLVPATSSSTTNLDALDMDFWVQVNSQHGLPDDFSDARHPVGIGEAEEAVFFPTATLDNSSLRRSVPDMSLFTSHYSTSKGSKQAAHSPSPYQSSAGIFRADSVPQTPIVDQVAQDSDDDITNQISSRFGRMRLAEDGQLRYYGATSHFSMLPNELGSLCRPHVRYVRKDGEAAVDRVNLHWTPDLDYEDHLTKLYFAWHSPFVNEVDKDIYLREKKHYDSGQDTPLYSPALGNAV